MGVLDVLTIVFITLKLLGVISWSWWLVLMPTLAPLALAAVAYAVAFWRT
jgi:hypothetical protein